MSDFLLNLARRSAGLAPVVRSRSMPPAGIVEDGGIEVHTEMTGESAAPPPAAVVPDAPPPAPAPRIEARIQPVVVPVSATPAPVVQRVPLAMPAASAPPAPVPPAVAVPPAVLPRMPVAPARAEPLPPAAAAALAIPEPAAIEPRIESRVEIQPPAVLPPAEASPLVPSDPPMPRTVREPEAARLESRVIERLIEPAAPVPAAPVAVMIEPAPPVARPIAPAAPRMEPMPERTIHVRIGAIEIHAAQPAAVALPPSPPAAAVPEVPSTAGFDDLARLRSYAPWEW